MQSAEATYMNLKDPQKRSMYIKTDPQKRRIYIKGDPQKRPNAYLHMF